jgi:hypothetical protein
VTFLRLGVSSCSSPSSKGAIFVLTRTAWPKEIHDDLTIEVILSIGSSTF